MYIDLIVGRRGAGKTALLIELADRAAQDGYASYMVQSVKPLPSIHPRVSKTWDFSTAVRRGWYHRPCVIFVDEFMAFHDDPNFMHILLYGRNQQMALVLDTQRPALIPSSLRALANRIYIFQMFDETDWGWVKRNIGQSYADRAKSLQLHEYFIFPEEESDVRKIDSGDRKVRPDGGREAAGTDPGAAGGPSGNNKGLPELG